MSFHDEKRAFHAENDFLCNPLLYNFLYKTSQTARDSRLYKQATCPEQADEFIVGERNVSEEKYENCMG